MDYYARSCRTSILFCDMESLKTDVEKVILIQVPEQGQRLLLPAYFFIFSLLFIAYLHNEIEYNLWKTS